MIARQCFGTDRQNPAYRLPSSFYRCEVDTNELQQYFYEQIPITKHMGIEVIEAVDSRVLLSAPLQGNTNHKSTVFGGSLNSLATLACWGLVKLCLEKHSISGDIVIAGSEIRYLNPVTGKFYAECRCSEPERIDRFIHAFGKYGKARIGLDAMVLQDDVVKVAYHGAFAAI